jgi:RHS repeat-associated protein
MPNLGATTHACSRVAHHRRQPDIGGCRFWRFAQGEVEHADQVLGWDYDRAGSLLDDGTATYTYDARSRLTARDTTSYTYNGDGVLVAQLANSMPITYTQDLAAPLSQMLQIAQGGTTTNYLYGLDRLAAVSGGTRTWYAADALGSVRQTLDDSGAVLGRVDYDPWGQVESGTVPTFGFTGEVQDSLGMVYLRARWYNPAQGRFGVRDPFAGDPERPYSQHPYQYGASDPVSNIDPSGWCSASPLDYGDPCIRAYTSVVARFGDTIAPYELIRWEEKDLSQLRQWLGDGLAFTLGTRNWTGDAVRTVLNALNRVEKAVGSHQTATKVLALGRGMKADLVNMQAGDLGPWASVLLGPATGASLYDGRNSIIHLSAAGGLPSEVNIIHELGHRVDQFAGEKYIAQVNYWPQWSSLNKGWLEASGWIDLLSGAECRAQAVSAYARDGFYGVLGDAAYQYYHKHRNDLLNAGYDSLADFINAATRDSEGKRLSGGSSAEDFAETFAWYVMHKTGGTFLPSGGIPNIYNKSGEPNQQRIDALESLIEEYR